MRKHYSIRLEAELIRIFKMVASVKEITLQEAMEEAVEDWIRIHGEDYFTEKLDDLRFEGVMEEASIDTEVKE